MPTPPAVDRTDLFTLTWRRIATVAALGVVLLLLVLSDELHALLLDTVAWASGFVSSYPVLGIGAFVLLSAASAMLAFFSSGLLVPVALATWGVSLTLVLLWGGWILGGVIAYVLSRFVGRRLVSALAPADVLAYGDRLSANTPFRYLLLFQLAVPSEIPGYVLGLVRYRFAGYLGAVALAELPYAVGTVLLGDSIMRQQLTSLVVLGALLIGFSIWAFRRFRSHWRAGRETAANSRL